MTKNKSSVVLSCESFRTDLSAQTTDVAVIHPMNIGSDKLKILLQYTMNISKDTRGLEMLIQYLWSIQTLKIDPLQIGT